MLLSEYLVCMFIFAFSISLFLLLQLRYYNICDVYSAFSEYNTEQFTPAKVGDDLVRCSDGNVCVNIYSAVHIYMYVYHAENVKPILYV